MVQNDTSRPYAKFNAVIPSRMIKYDGVRCV